MTQVITEYGEIDILYNNVGGSTPPEAAKGAILSLTRTTLRADDHPRK
jgi:hypothetical protein